MKKQLLLAGSLFALSMVAFPQGACAEMMDYSSLQDLFGEPVTIGATGTPQKASEVATNMTIITAEMIARANSRDIPKIIDAYVAGMDIMQGGRMGYDVGVRGYQEGNQPRLLVLIDGRQVFIDDYSRTAWETLPVNPDDIYQIEVVKGPASALFGSNAAGGVVNIITKNPLFIGKNVASVSVGTDGLMIGDTTVVSQISENSAIKVSAGGSSMNEFGSARHADEEATKIKEPKRNYINMFGVFKINPQIQTFLEGTYSYSQSNEVAFSSSVFAQKAKNYSLRGGGSWNSSLGMVSINNYLNRNIISAHLSDYPSNLGVDTTLFVSQVEDQFKVGDHTLRFALEYRYKDFAFAYEDPSWNEQNPDLREDNITFGTTWLWQATPKLSLTNAVRFDHLKMKQKGSLGATSIVTDSDFSHVINEITANSGIVYNLSRDETLRATFGRGVQMPSLIHTGLSGSLPTSTANTYLDLQGNPDLKPTIVYNYELGYERKLPSLASKARLSFYYQMNRNLISTNPVRPVSTVAGNTLLRIQQVNAGHSQGFGGELEINGQADGFRWSFSYSLAKVLDSEYAKSVVTYNDSTPEHHIRMNLGYSYKKWDFDANAAIVTSRKIPRYTGSILTPPLGTDGYMTVGARIGYKISDQFIVSLSGVNINHQSLAETAFPEIERQGMLTVTGRF